MAAANLPLHHPVVLQTNLLASRRSAAVASMQSLLKLLEPSEQASTAASADDSSRQAAYTPPVRVSGEAARLLDRRPSQNGAQALTSPAAAYSDGQGLGGGAVLKPQHAGLKSLVKAAEHLDLSVLSWAEEVASEPANMAAHHLLAWDESNAESTSIQDDPRSAASSEPVAKGAQQVEGNSRKIGAAETEASGTGRAAGKANGKTNASPTKQAADPGAFDPGAFGMAGIGGSNEEEEQADTSPQTLSTADNGAFDLSAFGFGQPDEGKQDSQGHKNSSQLAADPGAFDPGAFGFGIPKDDEEEDGKEDQKSSADLGKPAADPGSFNPNAFGFGFSNGQDEDQDEGVPQPAADPGAFDPSAFGFGSSPGQEQDDEESTTALKSQPAADPGAFDPAAFGFGPSSSQDKDDDEPKSILKAKPAADPGAFDPSAFGFGVFGNGQQQAASKSSAPAGMSRLASPSRKPSVPTLSKAILCLPVILDPMVST